eukprot:TRINITY_DN4051_c0_g1_i1.p1 TRINITY_DN4051_c0_g1~~TRINITY_DN4051_c0_g1_i1.p1  ORF type:complete len:363 (-),score=78.33 TRINITY_DN4051_c0_g1_i1:134-1222(-)
MSKVVTSAVVIIPPEDQWKQVQEIRAKHDKAYGRWMPHINLLYPFIPESEFRSVYEKTVEALSTVKPFKVIFDDFDAFNHGRSYTLFMKPRSEPSDGLLLLQAELERIFPHCNDRGSGSEDGFVPHMTCGQFMGKISVERAKNDFKQKVSPIEFELTHVHFISRTQTDPFVIKYSIPLGYSKQTEEEQSSSNSEKSNTLYDHEFSRLDEDMKIVVKRVEKWMQNLKKQNKLPKTTSSLKSAIRTICILQKPVITDIETIFNKLKNEGYYKVVGNKIEYKKPDSHYSTTNVSFFTSDEEEVTQRCRNWVFVDSNAPKSSTALKNALKQLVTTKKQIEPQHVLDFLEKVEKLSLEGYEDVKYRL